MAPKKNYYRGCGRGRPQPGPSNVTDPPSGEQANRGNISRSQARGRGTGHKFTKPHPPGFTRGGIRGRGKPTQLPGPSSDKSAVKNPVGLKRSGSELSLTSTTTSTSTVTKSLAKKTKMEITKDTKYLDLVFDIKPKKFPNSEQGLMPESLVANFDRNTSYPVVNVSNFCRQPQFADFFTGVYDCGLLYVFLSQGYAVLSSMYGHTVILRPDHSPRRLKLDLEFIFKSRNIVKVYFQENIDSWLATYESIGFGSSAVNESPLTADEVNDIREKLGLSTISELNEFNFSESKAKIGNNKDLYLLAELARSYTAYSIQVASDLAGIDHWRWGARTSYLSRAGKVGEKVDPNSNFDKLRNDIYYPLRTDLVEGTEVSDGMTEPLRRQILKIWRTKDRLMDLCSFCGEKPANRRCDCDFFMSCYYCKSPDHSLLTCSEMIRPCGLCQGVGHDAERHQDVSWAWLFNDWLRYVPYCSSTSWPFKLSYQNKNEVTVGNFAASFLAGSENPIGNMLKLVKILEVNTEVTTKFEPLEESFRVDPRPSTNIETSLSLENRELKEENEKLKNENKTLWSKIFDLQKELRDLKYPLLIPTPVNLVPNPPPVPNVSDPVTDAVSENMANLLKPDEGEDTVVVDEDMDLLNSP